MTTAATQQRDRLVRNIKNYAAERGRGPLEVAMRSPGPHISRQYLIHRLMDDRTELRRRPGPGDGEILCTGATLGLCDDGRVRHYRTYNGSQRFVGFHEKTVDADTILVRSRGLAELHVGPGAQPGDP